MHVYMTVVQANRREDPGDTNHAWAGVYSDMKAARQAAFYHCKKHFPEEDGWRNHFVGELVQVPNKMLEKWYEIVVMEERLK